MHDVLDLRDLLGDELRQRRESGRDVSALEGAVAGALRDGADETRLAALLDALDEAPPVPGWPYEEPSGADEIIAAREELPPLPPLTLDDEELRDRITAAWLGRCAGCVLGKPLEGIDRSPIRTYLERVGAYPLLD